jgi:hypothetical protein
VNRYLKTLITMVVATLALVVAPLGGAATAAADPGDGTIEGAIQWMDGHSGDSGWEGLCEMAVENAYGTTGVWPSAIAHWQGAIDNGKAHPGDWDAPRGAFVYWNTSEFGHVGISDGNGGFYSSSVGGAIGHNGDKSYFVNYLGWSDAQVPA